MELRKYPLREVYSFHIANSGNKAIYMPANAHVNGVVIEGNMLKVQALVGSEMPYALRHFVIVGTTAYNKRFNQQAGWRYVGSVELEQGNQIHVFEVTNDGTENQTPSEETDGSEG